MLSTIDGNGVKMTTYLVSYDLRKEDNSEGYALLDAELVRLKAQHVQYSMWLINSDKNARQLKDDISAFLDENDRLFVSELVKNHSYGKAIAGTKDFIEKHPPIR